MRKIRDVHELGPIMSEHWNTQRRFFYWHGRVYMDEPGDTSHEEIIDRYGLHKTDNDPNGNGGFVWPELGLYWPFHTFADSPGLAEALGREFPYAP